jgi:serine/threonine protein phosphatase 1
MQILTPYLPHEDRPAGQLLGDGKRIYAIGDIHGRLDCLEAMFNAIEMDKTDHPLADVQEVYLSDYVDRGPQSRDVIERLIKRQQTHGAICLAGNHDDEFRSALHFGLNERWFLQGGRETLQSYGVAIPRDDQLSDANDAVKAEVPESHLQFLRALKEYHSIDRLFFAHAGIDPHEPVFSQSIQNYLWIREPFLSSERWHGYMIVHGHTPVSKPVVRPNRIGVDTAAFMSGTLTAVVLEPEGYRFLATAEKPDTRFGRLKQ